MYRIKTLRGTIFCAPIRYTKSFVEGLSSELGGYMPILLRDNGVMPILPTWQLTSPDESEILAFNGDKVDIVRIYESEIDDTEIKRFSDHCKIVFKKIMELTGYFCTRLALAPSVIVTEKGQRPSVLFNKLFAITNFEGASMETSNFSQVYRVDKTIGNQQIKINHVVGFKAESELVAEGGNNVVRDRYMGDFDINTMANPQYKFVSIDVDEFFDMVPECFSKFYSLYLTNN